MPNKMLIDASHPEETRVVVLRGNRIEEFDFESQDKKQLRGNIYLARVTRVEPSLQAAFVEYGGNRHGFLAFSEIHPDYYQIPVADRQALLEAEAEEAKAEDDDAEDGEARGTQKGGRKRRRASTRRKKAAADETTVTSEEAEADPGEEENELEAGDKSPAMAASVEVDVVSEDVRTNRNGTDENDGDEDDVDTVGAEDALDEAQNRRKPMRRNYKIQEVIKRRQILLVQVVKEERGNKGAALTTYLSLAGRYSVLMPNTARGGGISRKITNPQDRKRLKDVVRTLNVPDGMGVILRTAGANRTKAEVKRDYDYLMRLWEQVRNLTLSSTAPALVYEEGSLIKRSVRDLYNKDIGEILVAGEEGYREAKDFMRMLMPSHAKSVQPYREVTPIFAGNGIEAQLDRMLQPQVTLKSGGYIIINQTEALVAIDVNSGRSTKEHSIEDTALQTNLEAAEEVARQLRLRDLAGLIVIDFIDMEENRNNRAVEKRLKECLKNDRARIQVGRISHFGLLEMSRQRIRASVLESTMQPCPHCGGTGHVRSESSVALFVARSIEEYLLKDARNDIVVRTPTSTALYLLNQKRANLMELESRFGVSISVEADDTIGGQHFVIVKRQPADKSAHEAAVTSQNVVAVADVGERPPAPEAEDGEEGEGRKRKRKRRRRGGRNRNASSQSQPAQFEQDDVEDASADDEAATTEAPVLDSEADEADAEATRKKRHRGKRGGRRNRRDAASTEEDNADSSEERDADGEAAAEDVPPQKVSEETEATDPATAVSEQEEPVKKPRRTSRRKKTAGEDAPVSTAEAVSSTNEDALADEKAPAKKTRRPRKAAARETVAEDPKSTEAVAEEPAESKESPPASRRRKTKQTEEAKPVEPVVSSSEPAEEAPRKTGWWQRKGFF